MAAGFVAAQGPQLGDPDVHDGGRSVVRDAGDVACRLGLQRRLDRALRLEGACQVDAPARQPQLRARHPAGRKRRRRSPGTASAEPLGHLDVRLGLFGLPREQPHGGDRDRQLGVLSRRLRWKFRLQPPDRFEPPVQDEADVAVGEQARRVRPVRCCLRVTNRLDRMSVLLEPGGCRAVQGVDAGGVGAAQLKP